MLFIGGPNWAFFVKLNFKISNFENLQGGTKQILSIFELESESKIENFLIFQF